MKRLVSLFIVTIWAGLVTTSTAVAAEGWHATQVAGEVRVEIGNAPPVRLTLSMVIATDALIETAASGSATLARGEDKIVVAPNSRLRLPADDANGFTRIIEQFGDLFFQVSKRTQPHFRVDTPLLAATVKGTSFAVVVDEKGTKVNVREGLVLVENSASADSTLVAAGRSANVSAAQPMDLYLDRSLVPPAKLRLGEGHAHLFAGPDDATRNPPYRGDHSNHQAGDARASTVPGLSLLPPADATRRAPSSMVIDSTLSGIGFGILAAALAIVFIGTNRRPPGLVAAKAKRAADSERG